MSTSLTLTFDVDRSPEEAAAAINDVRGWWSGNVEGRTDRLGAEFTYTVEGIHYTKFRITQMEPGRRVAWLCLESWLKFAEDKEEWTGTTITFDIEEHDGGTRVTFTQHGLYPEHDCYELCSTAWDQYVRGSLRQHIASGAGRPNSFEGEEVLESLRSTGVIPSA